MESVLCIIDVLKWGGGGGGGVNWEKKKNCFFFFWFFVLWVWCLFFFFVVAGGGGGGGGVLQIRQHKNLSLVSAVFNFLVKFLGVRVWDERYISDEKPSPSHNFKTCQPGQFFIELEPSQSSSKPSLGLWCSSRYLTIELSDVAELAGISHNEHWQYYVCVVHIWSS